MGKVEKRMTVSKDNFFISGILMVCIIFLSLFSIAYFDVLALSPYQEIGQGENPPFFNDSELKKEKNWRLPVQPQISGQGEDFAAAMAAGDEGYQVELTLEGVVPLKKIDVEVVTPEYLLVGGHSIGILLQTNGVTAVGHSPVILESGEGIYPAKDAGLITGDFITSINGQEIGTNKQMAQLVEEAGQAGKDLIIEYIRDGVKEEIKVSPLYCHDSQSYRIGLYVRDNTAGIGTLTYYDPATKGYGALGHKIAKLDGKSVEGESLGSVLRAEIQGIKIGRKGVPGEKMGVFVGNSWRGTIRKNTNLGIFGFADAGFTNPYFPEPLPVAFIGQVELGPAQICTVVKGEELGLYEIEINKILPNYRSSGKGMVIEITDEELLSQTGGIVQGMSGSPIVQNGRLVGAVTHVFINDPTKGYACFIEWMLDESK